MRQLVPPTHQWEVALGFRSSGRSLWFRDHELDDGIALRSSHCPRARRERSLEFVVGKRTVDPKGYSALPSASLSNLYRAYIDCLN